MIIGTAGHVDHGKTTLVKVLTGVDTDRLAEEKRRGISIDLGYAYSDNLGFIDVPGHERFVHTMLAGASGIDVALLVVALPEGIRQQTREHLQILSLLGINHAVVALTKADLAADRIPAVTAELDALLAATPLAGAPIIPVAPPTGQGIEALRTALRSCAPAARNTDGYPRLAADRAFTLAGTGLIVTGTLVSGRIAVEDRLVLSPAGLEVRVRGLHAQNKPADHAVAGQRVALNITGSHLHKDMVARGDWVLHPAVHAPTDTIDARITLLPDLRHGHATAPASAHSNGTSHRAGPSALPALRHDTEVHLHLGAAHVMARVSLLDTERLVPGDNALARLTLRQRIGALAGDRIVLRDTGATRTIGGGIVLDPSPPRRGRRSVQRLAQLAALEAADPLVALRNLLSIPPGWTDAAVFLRARNLVADTVLGLPEFITTGGLLLLPETFDRIRTSIVAVLEAHHHAAPELPGLQIERLRVALPDRPPMTGLRDILHRLLQQGVIAQDGPWLRLPGHRISLSPQDERLWKAAMPLIKAERFRPPRVRDLAKVLTLPEPALRTTLKRLQRMGQVVEVAPDHFFLQDAVAEMAVIAADVVRVDGLLTAAAFRDQLDNGRKVAIQILEFFDRTGVTQRSGDVRQMRPDWARIFRSAGEPAPVAAVQVAARR